MNKISEYGSEYTVTYKSAMTVQKEFKLKKVQKVQKIRKSSEVQKIRQFKR
jgi:hypothetical protein